MNKIHLHIEHLSLPGYTPAEHCTFLAALERELATRLTASGTQRELHPETYRVLRVTSPDLLPQTVAHSAIAGLSLGTSKEGTK